MMCHSVKFSSWRINKFLGGPVNSKITDLDWTVIVKLRRISRQWRGCALKLEKLWLRTMLLSGLQIDLQPRVTLSYLLHLLVNSDQAAGKRAGEVQYEKRDVAQHLHLPHTVWLALWYRTTLHLSHPWGCALGQPMKQASALVRKGGMCHLIKKQKRKLMRRNT